MTIRLKALIPPFLGFFLSFNSASQIADLAERSRGAITVAPDPTGETGVTPVWEKEEDGGNYGKREMWGRKRGGKEIP